jgi:hypothetical protein
MDKLITVRDHFKEQQSYKSKVKVSLMRSENSKTKISYKVVKGEISFAKHNQTMKCGQKMVTLKILLLNKFKKLGEATRLLMVQQKRINIRFQHPPLL